MDNRGALGGGHAAAEGPRPDFFFAGSEVGGQAEEVIGAADERGDPGVGDAEGLQELGGLGGGEVAQLGFDLGADDDVLAAMALADQGRDRGDVAIFRGVGQV